MIQPYLASSSIFEGIKATPNFRWNWENSCRAISRKWREKIQPRTVKNKIAPKNIKEFTLKIHNKPPVKTQSSAVLRRKMARRKLSILILDFSKRKLKNQYRTNPLAISTMASWSQPRGSPERTALSKKRRYQSPILIPMWQVNKLRLPAVDISWGALLKIRKIKWLQPPFPPEVKASLSSLVKKPEIKISRR